MLFTIVGWINSLTRNTAAHVRGKKLGGVIALGLFISSLCLGWSLLPAAAPQLPPGLFLAYGPADFVRGSGKPAPDTRNFSLLNTQTEYRLQIFNGGLDSQFAGASSAVVTVNGQQVASPSDFNQNVRLIERTFTPALANSLTAELRSAPKSGFTIRVVGVDNQPPTISAAAAPSQNQYGWNKTNVSVSFNCADSISGIETCSSPVGVTGEGAGQVVTGTATDRAQNIGTASLTINLDKTAPSINAVASPSANANGWNNTDVTVNFNCVDNLSGLENCSSPVTVAAEGAGQLVTGTAVDRAQNSRQASLTVNLDKTAPAISISSPAGGSAVTDPNVTVTGTITDSTSGVETVTCGGAAATLSGANFSCVQSLNPGPNAIIVAATDKAGNHSSTTLNVTRNPEVVAEEEADIKSARLAPNVIFVGESEQVTVSARIPSEPGMAEPVVTLQRIDTTGNVLAIEGELHDDGDVTHGDLVKGDGLFTFQNLYTAENVEQLRFRVSYHQAGAELRSQVLQLGFYNHLTETQINTILSTQQAAAQSYESLSISLGQEAAREAVLAQLRQNPVVITAGVAENSSTISVLYRPGILGAISQKQPGTRGGGSEVDTPVTLAEAPLRSFASALPRTQTIASNDEEEAAENMVGSKRAIILSPYHAEFAPNDESAAIEQLLRDSCCPEYDVTHLADQATSVDSFKNLDSYGIIAIISHGDTVWKGLFEGAEGFLGLLPREDPFMLFSSEFVNQFSVRRREDDLLSGRVALVNLSATDGVYSILPSFIPYYSTGEFPNSLVYLGTCKSARNDSMAQAFLRQGAKTYLGYTNYVSTKFAQRVGLEFFQRFMGTPTRTTGGEDGAYIPDQFDDLPCLDRRTGLLLPKCEDPLFMQSIIRAEGAMFRLFGSEELQKPGGLLDGGFELGDLDGWGFAFESSVFGQLGNIGPVSGDYMAMVFKNTTKNFWFGWLQQEFCLPTDATHIEFDWNFITEQQCESLSSGPDQLWIRLTADDPYLYHQLVTTDVQAQCSKFRPTSIDLPSEGSASATGWQHSSIDITDIARQINGKKVALVFEVVQAVNDGDRTVDSAVLIDNVKIVRETETP